MEVNNHSDELQHWGIKGMRWGQRRYQNADGSLTPAGQKRYNKEVEKLKKETAKVKAAEKEAANRKKVQSKFDALDAKKKALEERKKALKDDNDKKDDEQPEETVEQRRARLLKSSDPKELYEGRDALTYQELNDRVNRIDLETRLQNKIPAEAPKKGALDRMDDVSNAIYKATNLYRSVDNAYATVKNSAIGKTLAKSLGLETETKEFNLADFVVNRNKKSTQEMMDTQKRLQAEEYVVNEHRRRENKAKADAEYRAKKEAVRKAKVDAAKSELDTAKDMEKEAKRAVKDAKAADKAAKEDLSYLTMPVDVKSAEADLRAAKERVREATERLRKAEKSDDDELMHYGVKGMKWGVRRYQDYNGRLTAAGKQHAKDTKINKKIEEYIKSGKARVDNLKDYNVGELTTMTTAAGEKYVSGLMNGHDFDWQEITNYDDIGYQSPAMIIKNYSSAHQFGRDETITATHSAGRIDDRDLRECNPGFGAAGTTQNCAKCSAALELRMRGYGISAGRQTYPSSVDAQSLWFKDAKRVEYDYDTVQEALTSYGPKTSGTLSYRYPNNAGGHAMHWTVDESGTFEIQDGQNGRRFSSVSEMMDTYGGDKSASLSTYRLDNCEPNYDMMAQDSVIRRSSKTSKVQNKFSGKIVDRW